MVGCTFVIFNPKDWWAIMSEYMQYIIPAVVGLVSSVSGFVIAKSNNKKDITVNDRQQLSEDEKQFRAELKGMIDSYKVELAEAREEIKSLREEVSQFHMINTKLSVEKEQLSVEKKKLEAKLQRYKQVGEK